MVGVCLPRMPSIATAADADFRRATKSPLSSSTSFPSPSLADKQHQSGVVDGQSRVKAKREAPP